MEFARHAALKMLWTKVREGWTPSSGTIFLINHRGGLMKSNKGFTLIELLVVIAIIGLVASIILVSLNSAREKARIASTQAELSQFYLAIELLYDDTGQHPRHLSPSPCVQNPELYLDTCRAGLECTDGGFPDWNGPYIPKVPEDPWGNRYIFDPDYRCNSGVLGCEGIPNGTMTRTIHSGGPNGSGINGYDSDNIVLVLCR